jgi:tRNA(fMet)-specific endonuclease VapC
MNGYLLDSDVAIELLRGHNLQLAEKLASIPRQKVFLSAVTIFELPFGAYRSRDSQQSFPICRKFCSTFQISPFDDAAADRAAEVRAHLEERGQRIGAYDILIAGVALAHGQIMVTHNTREFERVPGLQLQDWIKAS